MDIQISDLLMLLKAIEVANTKNAYNELEIQAFKPSFDKVHQFLNEYHAQAEAKSKQMSESTTSSSVNTPAAITESLEDEVKQEEYVVINQESITTVAPKAKTTRAKKAVAAEPSKVEKTTKTTKTRKTKKA